MYSIICGGREREREKHSQDMIAVCHIVQNEEHHVFEVHIDLRRRESVNVDMHLYSRHDIHSFAGPWKCAHSFARHFSYIHTGAPAA